MFFLQLAGELEKTTLAGLPDRAFFLYKVNYIKKPQIARESYFLHPAGKTFPRHV